MGFFGKKLDYGFRGGGDLNAEIKRQQKAEKARRLAEKQEQAREDKRKRELELLRKRTELFQARSRERRSLEELRKSRRAASRAITGGHLIPKAKKRRGSSRSSKVRLF